MTVGRGTRLRAWRTVALGCALALSCVAAARAADDMPLVPGERPDLAAVADEPDRAILVAATIPDDLRPENPEALGTLLPPPDTRPDADLDALYRVLSPADAQLYARIFSAQANADWATADSLITQVDDPILMGHVLAQRYLHPTGWLSSWPELSAWMERYADLPDAPRIYALALKRKPEGASAPRAPQDGTLDRFIGEVELTPASVQNQDFDWSDLSTAQRSQLREIVRNVRSDIHAGRNDEAARRLASGTFRDLADPLTQDRIAAEVAQGYFVDGDDAAALALARPALERSGPDAPLAGWVAGLAAFRQGDYDGARRAFEILAAGPADRDLVIAGAYWAARLNLLNGRPEKVRPYLHVAATYPYSFYGLLARRALGTYLSFDETLPRLTDDERINLGSLPEVRRAVALVEAGQQHRADGEFNRVSAASQPALALALLRLSGELGLPATQYRLGGELLRGYAERYDAALYPLPPWEPREGFSVDPALLYAIMRRESGFYAFSRSDAGASGPMQIMPATAAYISGDNGYLGAKRNLLNDPRIALDLAQDYIGYLIESQGIDGNLFFVLAAYNAGPGNLQRWLSVEGSAADPLLFIESIPSRETRFFVERVMANYWMYHLRLGASTPTLDMVASGAWPLYPDQEITSLARN
jgi:soluble lytic murein transglycosylase